jgi:hypothetical protein
MTLYKPGDKVILGEHQRINGSKNWSSEMAQYVGKEAIITGIASHDKTCQCYNVDIDKGTWEWRENVMTPVSGTGTHLSSTDVAYGCHCTKCQDYNQYVPSDTKNFVCYGCKH